MNGPPGPPIGLIPFGGGIPGIPGIPCIGNGGGNGIPLAGLPLKPPCGGKGIGGKGIPFGGGNGGIPRPGPPGPGGMNGGGRPKRKCYCDSLIPTSVAAHTTKGEWWRWTTKPRISNRRRHYWHCLSLCCIGRCDGVDNALCFFMSDFYILHQSPLLFMNSSDD